VCSQAEPGNEYKIIASEQNGNLQVMQADLYYQISRATKGNP